MNLDLIQMPEDTVPDIIDIKVTTDVEEDTIREARNLSVPQKVATNRASTRFPSSRGT